MSDPTHEHVEAVAHALDHADDEARQPHVKIAGTGEFYARALLTSTDPAVLDAMEAALVRAGRLTRQHTTGRCSCGAAGWQVQHYMADEHLPIPDTSRLVTKWQEANS